MKEKHTYHHDDSPGKLPEAWRANPYTVPNGYFENLYLQTTQRCKNSSNTPSALGVPDGYFEHLADSITAKIAEQALKAAVNESGFVVPNDYFSKSEQRLLAIHQINERVTETGFSLPEHYFDTLPERIGQQSFKIEPPVRKLRRSKWMAYAAAASIALVLGLGGLLRIANDVSETKSPLASVSDQQIVDYLELYGTPNDMIYISSDQLDDVNEYSIGEGISEEDIEAYLNHTL